MDDRTTTSGAESTPVVRASPLAKMQMESLAITADDVRTAVSEWWRNAEGESGRYLWPSSLGLVVVLDCSGKTNADKEVVVVNVWKA